MGNHALIIGTYFTRVVDSYDWSQELPNLADYDTIILDTPRIFTCWSYTGRIKSESSKRYLLSDKNEQDDKIKSNILLVRQKLLEMLWFNVRIYVLHMPTLIVDNLVKISRTFPAPNIVEKPTEFVKTNDWCPISIETYSETGKIITIKDDFYKQYFKNFKTWEYYFVSDSLKLDELERYYKRNWHVTGRLTRIATNNVSRSLAIEFQPHFHRWSYDEEGQGWSSFPDASGGKLILLPVINPYDTKPHVEAILQKIGLLDETLPPVWVNSIEIPGEVPRKKDIEKGKRQLEETASLVKEAETSLAELQKYKGLLYETGATLQNLAKSTFEMVGIKTKSSIVTDEFIIEVNGQEALIEVKGNVKSVTKDDVAQLVADLMEHLKTVGQEINGILIGNGWRLEPPGQRDIGNKPIFSRDAIKVAENHNIGLLSTIELFKAYCQVLKDPTFKKDLQNKIIRSKGVIKF